MPQRIVQARQEFSRRFAGRDDVCEFFQPDRYSAAVSVQDNLLFGRVALDQANAQPRISALVREVAAEEGLNDELVRLVPNLSNFYGNRYRLSIFLVVLVVYLVTNLLLSWVARIVAARTGPGAGRPRIPRGGIFGGRGGNTLTAEINMANTPDAGMGSGR